MGLSRDEAMRGEARTRPAALLPRLVYEGDLVLNAHERQRAPRNRNFAIRLDKHTPGSVADKGTQCAGGAAESSQPSAST